MTNTIMETSYNFTQLTPDNSYTVTVVGRNDAGVGEYASVIENTSNLVPLGKYMYVVECTLSTSIYVCMYVCMYR